MFWKLRVFIQAGVPDIVKQLYASYAMIKIQYNCFI